MATKRAILNELMRARRVLLFGHRDPDGDSAGSLLALAAALSDREIYCYSEGKLPHRYGFLDPRGLLHDTVDADFAPDLAVALECPSRSRLGAGLSMLRDDTRVVNIDHHRDNENYGDLNWIDVQAAALGEMIYDLLLTWGKEITPQIATHLYTAILTDTGRFHYRGTSARTLEICSQLVGHGADPSAITEQVYYGLPFSYLLLVRSALAGMQSSPCGRVLAFALHPEDFAGAKAAPGDAEGIVDLTLVSDQIRIGLLFRAAEPGQVKVSFRSQDSIDVGALAAEWGGGGHKNASGCVIAGSIPEVRALVMARAAELVEHGT
jgi:phosphoesterase RecJ-like protein